VGKILVDWSQNDDHKTTICVYSLRAKERPTVSTPVTWAEVENCLAKRDPNLLVFDSVQVLERVKQHGDLFEPVLKLKQKLPPMAALADVDPASAVSAKPAKRTTAARERQRVMGAKKAAPPSNPAKSKRKTSSRPKQKRA
jgi:bifunctional non-homologous end joining protein LigD